MKKLKIRDGEYSSEEKINPQKTNTVFVTLVNGGGGGGGGRFKMTALYLLKRER